MTVLKSSISPTSATFKSNAAALASLVDELKSRMAVAALACGLGWAFLEVPYRLGPLAAALLAVAAVQTVTMLRDARR